VPAIVDPLSAFCYHLSAQGNGLPRRVHQLPLGIDPVPDDGDRLPDDRYQVPHKPDPVSGNANRLPNVCSDAMPNSGHTMPGRRDCVRNNIGIGIQCPKPSCCSGGVVFAKHRCASGVCHGKLVT
jgi:hypothetical protein